MRTHDEISRTGDRTTARRAGLLGLAIAVAMLVLTATASASVYYTRVGAGHEGLYRDQTLLVSGPNFQGATVMDGYVYYSWFSQNPDGTTQSYIGRVAPDGTQSIPEYRTLPVGWGGSGELITSGSAIYFSGGTATYDGDGNQTAHVWIGQMTASGTFDPEWTDLGQTYDGTGDPEAGVLGLGGDPQGDVYWAWGCGVGKVINGGAVDKDWIKTDPCGGDAYVGIAGSATHLYIARYSTTVGDYVEQADPSGNVQNASFITGLGSGGGFPQLAIWDKDIWVNQLGVQITAYTPDGQVVQTLQPGYGPGASSAADADPTVGGTATFPTSVTCSPNPVTAGSPTTCTTTVTQGGSPPPAGTPSPTGTIYLESTVAGTFSDNVPGCTLVATGPGTASCSVVYAPQTAGQATIQANYIGSGPGVGQTTLEVDAPGTVTTSTTTTPSGDGDSGGSSSSGGTKPSGAGTGTPKNSGGTGEDPQPNPSTGTHVFAGATLTIGPPKVSGTTADVQTKCVGNAPCMVTANLTANETLKNGKPTEISAAERARSKTIKRTVVLGTTTATIRAGTTRTLKLKLNRAGLALLRSHSHLQLTLRVSEGKVTRTARVTFKRPTSRGPRRP